MGSMNPEEGRLRPQIMDRFGLRVPVQGLMGKQDRLEIYRRVRRYQQNRRKFVNEWSMVTAAARDEIIAARELLRDTDLSDDATDLGLALVEQLGIDSHRAEYAMFEAARAYAAADGRTLATIDDVCAVAPMALRHRRSQFMVDYFNRQAEEDERIQEHIIQLTQG
jgi:magnesium chelatase subunit I